MIDVPLQEGRPMSRDSSRYAIVEPNPRMNGVRRTANVRLESVHLELIIGRRLRDKVYVTTPDCQWLAVDDWNANRMSQGDRDLSLTCSLTSSGFTIY